MKYASIVTALAFLFVCLTGCQDTGKGKTGDKELKVSVPATLSVKAGDSTEMKISLTRTKVDGAVTVSLDVPEGLTVDKKELKFDKEDKEKEVKVTGDKDGTFTIKTTAKGGDVSSSAGETKVTVTKKSD